MIDTGEVENRNASAKTENVELKEFDFETKEWKFVCCSMLSSCRCSLIVIIIFWLLFSSSICILIVVFVLFFFRLRNLYFMLGRCIVPGADDREKYVRHLYSSRYAAFREDKNWQWQQHLAFVLFRIKPLLWCYGVPATVRISTSVYEWHSL